LTVSVVPATDTDSPDLVYTFDPLLVTDRGAIPLRSGKPTRLGEEDALETWTAAHGIPTLGRIEPPGTVDGGDTFWLRPDLLCIGRSLRTNRAGSQQLAGIVGGHVEIFDLPYWRGPSQLPPGVGVVVLSREVDPLDLQRVDLEHKTAFPCGAGVAAVSFPDAAL
jgi:hypothetical protein